MGNICHHCCHPHDQPDPSPEPTELNDISLKTLQADVGHSPRITIENFENWGKTQKSGKVFKVQPTTAEEVQRVVKAARKNNLKVRAVGSTHSWSPLYPDEGNILLDGTGLNKLHNGKSIAINEAEEKTVTIASGATVQEIITFFEDNNLCFPSNVILRTVTCAGIVSTGCHGVGKNQPCVSDWITAVTLVDSNGDIREFTQEHDGNDVMKAIQVSLGMFGIFITITMKVKDQFLVRADNLFPRLMDFFFDPKHLRDFINKNWSVEMFWFPFNGMELEHLDLWRAAVKGRVSEFSWNPMVDKLWVRAINPYKEGELHLPPVGKDYRRQFTYLDYLGDKMLQYSDKLERFLDDVGGIAKATDKFVHRHFDPVLLYLTFKLILDEYSEALGICENITSAIHYRTYKDLVPVYDMSFAFNCPDTEEGFHNACKAITYVIELVQKKAIEGKYPLTTTMEMRWISHSDTLLAPAIVGKPNGYTFYLEILSFEQTDDAMEFFVEVAKFWKTLECDGVKPLPHWGKQWSLVPGINQYLREGYGENMKKFKEVRESQHVDPQNVFTNGRLQDIFELN